MCIYFTVHVINALINTIWINFLSIYGAFKKLSTLFTSDVDNFMHIFGLHNSAIRQKIKVQNRTMQSCTSQSIFILFLRLKLTFTALSQQ